jgi:F0F1-type ATP synthase membrane subunit b/b'
MSLKRILNRTCKNNSVIIKRTQIKKKLVKTQKQLIELRNGFNKLQNEAKEIIKKGIYEINKAAQNMKVEYNKDIEVLRKTNQTEIKEIKSS